MRLLLLSRDPVAEGEDIRMDDISSEIRVIWFPV